MAALLSGMAFLTVTWSGQALRVVIAVLMFSVLGLIASAALAMVGAAGATYARPPAGTTTPPRTGLVLDPSRRP